MCRVPSIKSCGFTRMHGAQALQSIQTTTPRSSRRRLNRLGFPGDYADGSGSCPGTEPHEVCGTSTTATSEATVTVTDQDTDANQAAGDQGTLTFQVEVRARPTVAANPSPLTEANLDGATPTVTLPNGFTPSQAASPRPASRWRPTPCRP